MKNSTFKFSIFKAATIIALLIIGLFLLTKTNLYSVKSLEKTKYLVLNPDDYHDLDYTSTKKQLLHRIELQPFNAITFIIFALAITHTFFAHKISQYSTKLQNRYKNKPPSSLQLFYIEFLYFMGEIEVILGIWVIPLLIAMTIFFSWDTAIYYLDNIRFTEPLFVGVIMATASSKPILIFAENCLKQIAKIGNSTVESFWWTLLTIGPLLGSFITEAASMTICALLLGKEFYIHRPSQKFAYATLALLFTNISVGGVLTNYSAPPVLMIQKAWGYTSGHMFKTFGIKAFFGILISNFIYWLFFRKEFAQMEINRKNDKTEKQAEITIPKWITFTHLVFLTWIVIHLHHPVIFIGSFLLYLGFYKATLPFQSDLELKTPILVGFFLASLMIHGNLQQWWIGPVLQEISKELLMGTALVLTAFNDNAQITFLATLIPNFDEAMKYAIIAGAITGGGLTIIANAPNLVGQTFLKQYFKEGISALNLFLSALLPTLIIGLIFYLFQPKV